MAPPPIDSTTSSPTVEPSSDDHPRSPTIEQRIDSELDGFRRWRKKRNPTQFSLQQWGTRQPYHEYVHKLVEAGWENLLELDNYLYTGPRKQPGIIVSVVDISEGFKKKCWPDIKSEHELKKFMLDSNKEGVKVRFYMAEYSHTPETCIIEALGSGLKLDPRFFNWAIGGRGHVSTPSQRHRAPYIELGFGILNATTDQRTNAERFTVLVYIQPNDNGDGWTGIILFSSHTKIKLSPRIITDPPPFSYQLPPPMRLAAKSFRELYIESFEFIDIEKAVLSPFYAISNLLRLNSFCWNQIISAIREEDHRIHGISDTSIGHAEEIKKSLAVVERCGSLGWRDMDLETTRGIQGALEEDFKHLVEQTEFLWQTRGQMASMQNKRAETRWTTLTNAFTYIFAPVTIISGIYGMNVSEISGSSSNPNIWQFFVAVAAFNVTILVVLAASYWLVIQARQKRAAGVKEIVGYAVGRTNA